MQFLPVTLFLPVAPNDVIHGVYQCCFAQERPAPPSYWSSVDPFSLPLPSPQAWRGVLIAKAAHRDACVLCIQLATRCYWARMAWDARVDEKERHEHLIATLLGEG